MKTKDFDFSFDHLGRKYHANLQIMKPFKTSMYRVKVGKIDRKHDQVFIFYEINEADKRFFYFPMNEFKRSMAESLLKALRNY